MNTVFLCFISDFIQLFLGFVGVPVRLHKCNEKPQLRQQRKQTERMAC